MESGVWGGVDCRRGNSAPPPLCCPTVGMAQRCVGSETVLILIHDDLRATRPAQGDGAFLKGILSSLTLFGDAALGTRGLVSITIRPMAKMVKRGGAPVWNGRCWRCLLVGGYGLCGLWEPHRREQPVLGLFLGVVCLRASPSPHSLPAPRQSMTGGALETTISLAPLLASLAKKPTSERGGLGERTGGNGRCWRCLLVGGYGLWEPHRREQPVLGSLFQRPKRSTRCCHRACRSFHRSCKSISLPTPNSIL